LPIAIIDVDALAALQETNRRVGHRREQHFPADLEHPLGEEHLDDQLVGPADCTQERGWIEDQTVDPLTDDRRTDRPRPEMTPFRPDFHSRQNVAVGELAGPEGADRSEDDPRYLAEDLLIGVLT